MRRRRKMRSAGTTTSSQLSRKKKIVIRVITTIPCHERIHDIRKKKKKISFIVVPRRRENFSFPTFPSSSFFFLLFLNCKIEKISLDLVARISLFFYPIRSSMDGRNEDRGTFLFFFFLRHRHRAASQNSMCTLERTGKTNSETRYRSRSQENNRSEDFSSRSISSIFFLDAVPRGRVPPAAWRDHSPVSLYCVCFNFFSYKWKAD